MMRFFKASRSNERATETIVCGLILAIGSSLIGAVMGQQKTSDVAAKMHRLPSRSLSLDFEPPVSAKSAQIGSQRANNAALIWLYVHSPRNSPDSQPVPTPPLTTAAIPFLLDVTPFASPRKNFPKFNPRKFSPQPLTQQPLNLAPAAPFCAFRPAPFCAAPLHQENPLFSALCLHSLDFCATIFQGLLLPQNSTSSRDPSNHSASSRTAHPPRHPIPPARSPPRARHKTPHSPARRDGSETSRNSSSLCCICRADR